VTTSRNCTLLCYLTSTTCFISPGQHHGFDDDTIERMRQYLHKPEQEELSPCECCGLHLSTLLLLPCCAGLLCSECMDGESSICLLCNSHFDADDFQRLQPGFAFTWKSNLELEKTTKLNLQPAAAEAAKDIIAPISSVRPHVEPVVIRPSAAVRLTRKFGDGHACEYDKYAIYGKCKLCNEEHSGCKLLSRNSRCDVCYRVAEDCPEEESKSHYLTAKLEELLVTRNPAHGRSLDAADNNKRPLKVIVYSQFRNALNVVGDRLLKRFGPACIAEYWGRYRSQELHKFIYSGDCFCMLLSNDGSTGLDLSFVTNIVFLEEIWDKSLQDQAVARAWRMGAKGRVEVETLTAKNTVEELMQEMEVSRSCGNKQDPRQMREHQQQKTKLLLQSVRLLTDYHQFSHQSKSVVHKNFVGTEPNQVINETVTKRKFKLNSASVESKRKKVQFLP